LQFRFFKVAKLLKIANMRIAGEHSFTKNVKDKKKGKM